MKPRLHPLLNRPECLQLMFEMYTVHKFTYKDLAIAFGCSRGAIEYRMSKELYKLRKATGNIWIEGAYI